MRITPPLRQTVGSGMANRRMIREPLGDGLLEVTITKMSPTPYCHSNISATNLWDAPIT